MDNVLFSPPSMPARDNAEQNAERLRAWRHLQARQEFERRVREAHQWYMAERAAIDASHNGPVREALAAGGPVNDYPWPWRQGDAAR